MKESVLSLKEKKTTQYFLSSFKLSASTNTILIYS